MKSSLNRSILIARTVLLGLTLAAVAAFAGAQEGDKAGAKRSGRSGAAEFDVDRMARVLQLTEDQKAEWRRVSEDHRAQVRPLLREMRELSQRLEEEANGAAPDPAVVGQLELDRRGVAQRLTAAQGAVEKDLVRLLDREQKIRWDALRENDRSGRRGPFGRRGRGPREE